MDYFYTKNLVLDCCLGLLLMAANRGKLAFLLKVLLKRTRELPVVSVVPDLSSTAQETLIQCSGFSFFPVVEGRALKGKVLLALDGKVLLV